MAPNAGFFTTLLVHFKPAQAGLISWLIVIVMSPVATLVPHSAQAWVLTITPGSRSLFLQVGTGTYTGGNYNTGGTPANNPTVNTVSVSVPAAAIGNSTAQAMTSNSATANSFYDGYATCTPPSQVYIGGWSRPGTGTGVAVLTVTTPANLTSNADVIPFSQIAWTSSANGSAAVDIAAGQFTGASITLASIAANTWVESCFTFSYRNTIVPAAGTYTGRATYTLSLP